MDATVLVTGASGFIGSHLCRRLSQSGAEVHAVSRTTRSGWEPSLCWWQGDMSDIATVRKLLKTIKPGVIFHLAAHGVGSRDLELVLPTFYSSLASTVHLLTLATEMGCRRFVLPGSLEEPETGSWEEAPSSPYAAAKWASSAYARMFQELYRLPVVIARVFMTYGPQQPVGKLLPYVILSLLQKQAPKLSRGQRQVDWIYIDDVVEGLLAAAITPGIEGCTVDLGSGILVTIRQVVEALVNIIESSAEPLFGALPDRPLEQVRVANTARSQNLMGWHPVTSLDEGLKKTVHWYADQLRKGAL